MISGWRALRRLMAGTERLVTASVAIAVVQAGLLVPIALLVKRAFDTEIPQQDTGALIVIGVVIVALFLTNAALGLLTRYLALRSTKTAIVSLRVAVLEKLYGLPRSYFDRTELTQIHSVVVQDTQRLQVMTSSLIGQLLPALVISTGLVTVLVFLQPFLFLMLATIAPVMLGLSLRLGNAVRARTRHFYDHFDDFSSQTLFALRAMTLTKIHATDRLELDRRRRQFDQLGEAERQMSWLHSAYTLINGAVGATAGVIVLVAGGTSVATGSVSLGDLISFYTALGLLRGQALLVLATVPAVITGLESIPRIEEILDRDLEEPYSGGHVHEPHGAIRLEHVDFSYGERPVLRNLDLEIDVGERVALIGPNGAGKSTAVSLILGLYRPQRGRVLFDDLPLAELDLHELRRHIGVVLQDPLLFSATVAENIAYGHPGIGRAALESAARRSTADELIAELPDGYETRIGDDGVLLSGGQRQRIALARAMLTDPPILILDEPTTYLDRDSSAALIAGLNEGRARSVLIVSHDESIADAVDRVYTLRDGTVAEEHARAPAQPPPAVREAWARRA